MDNKKKKFHFIGIGGAGMSGLAEVFCRSGYAVQGSDIKKTKVTDRLEAIGVDVKGSHSAGNVEGADYAVHSSCIKEDNPELQEARRRNIPVLRRIEALNILAEGKRLVAVSGAHGKTTTSSLISYLLIEAGFDPTVFIGADVHFLNGNARWGQSDLMVTEADESDGSFLFLKPMYSVTTNMDMEHMDYYSSMDNVIKAYKKFIDNTSDDGIAFVGIDDKNLRDLVERSDRKIVTYGISADADLRAENIDLLGLNGSSFDVIYKGKALGRIKLSIIGTHNILNTLAAIAVAMRLGADFSFIKDVIGNFKGADRRFNMTRLKSDIFVIDDYAHHPTEIKATLKTLENAGRRIVAVFQPHRYSRTKHLREQFGKCFDLADYLIITDIYSAHEKPIDGVSAKDLCESARQCGHKNVHFVPKDDIIKHLTDIIKPGDAVFILGAGDIDELPKKLIKTLTSQNCNAKDCHSRESGNPEL
ncbi:MAG: UDP-N-acetylmuramate--L-alanine ligase [Candidatus Omnitrophica bacterium]|nr:UDP-N-acetylmuramate--L-alanine ligase [Candidatus Omnitrophota bacterium]